MPKLTAENLRSLSKFYYAVTDKLGELADQNVPPKAVVAHLFHIAWICGVAAYEEGIASREEVMEIERDAYAEASTAAKEEDEQ